MIPPHVHPGCTSPGEVEIFRRLRDDPITRDWTVLHSLDVARHVKRTAGEVDFVVIVPGKGVLCLEVKACSRLERKEGAWYYGSDPSPDYRGPFRQATEAMHSVRNWLTSQRPDLARVPFGTGVIFPYVAFDAASGEWHPWQIIDRRSFSSGSLGALLLALLDHTRGHLAAKGALWFDRAATEPQPEVCHQLVQLLRPSFECLEPRKNRRQRLQEEVKRYTEEQFVALDAMAANPQVAFVGPAGSGKTVLALEAVRRSAAGGRRVLFLCFNSFLSTWLQEQVAGWPDRERIEVSTLHAQLRKVAQVQVPPGAGADFWERDLPQEAALRLIERGEGSQFDELVLDEAQDLLSAEYLSFLDLCLRSGIGAGRWRMFGDFAKQNIYGANRHSLRALSPYLANREPLWYNLTVNCRNTPRIAQYAEYLGALSPGYSRVLRPDDQRSPELVYYRDKAHQQQLLVEKLAGLYEDGFSGDEIVVLSTRHDASSAAAAITASPWAGRLRPYATAGSGHIGYCTMHAFKGLEAPAVVLTDVEQLDDAAAQDLLYVGMTRALDRLVVLCNESTQEAIYRILTERPADE